MVRESGEVSFVKTHVCRGAGTGPEVVKAARYSEPQSFVIV